MFRPTLQYAASPLSTYSVWGNGCSLRFVADVRFYRATCPTHHTKRNQTNLICKELIWGICIDVFNRWDSIGVVLKTPAIKSTFPFSHTTQPSRFYGDWRLYSLIGDNIAWLTSTTYQSRPARPMAVELALSTSSINRPGKYPFKSHSPPPAVFPLRMNASTLPLTMKYGIIPHATSEWNESMRQYIYTF